MSTPTEPSATATDPILDAYRAGHQTLLVTGRSLFDLHINERGELRPLRHTLIRRAKEEFGMATLLYNLALGPRWSWEGFDSTARREFESKLEGAQIPLHQEVHNTLRDRAPHQRAFDLLKSIQQTIEQGSEIPPILALVEFGEDLVPDSERGGTNDWIMQMNELLVLMGSDYVRRRHPFLMILTGTPERIDRRVVEQPAIGPPAPTRTRREAWICPRTARDASFKRRNSGARSGRSRDGQPYRAYAEPEPGRGVP